ncbi:STXBP5 [Bugula neritina]|uniref:STXBP5 n=1 Tax=Bugula neritina TaxID=10212 RepID=A0A7J7K3X6_BUGNE|nr:STXBP5 [Bugula neritina]
MKKFDLKGVKGVFANLRGGEKSASKGEVEIPETLQPHDFYCGKLSRHGFPFQPTCIAWDPIQKLVAVGTKRGDVRIIGKPGVDVAMQHTSPTVVLHIKFLINQGALITACSDDSINLWSYRQKVPEIVHSLKFCRERITCLYLAYQSKWLYLGTERGNVHIVNVETFTICGYIINWNKAIELSRKTHPGPVVHLSDNPMDPNKLLIGFETGLTVCWDLRCKMAESRFNSNECLRDACWSNEGKMFMCSYADGTLSTWNCKQPSKPVSVMTPHSKANKNGQLSPCKPINRLEWRAVKSGGGMSYEAGRSPCLTIMHGKDVTVLEMEHKILDFIVLCRNVWSFEYDDPYAIVVLLASDLIFVDMTIPGYPCFQCPYALDLHESPVTCLKYISDCAADLIPAIYSCGAKQLREGYSKTEFPVSGGECTPSSNSYSEILITGHADGSIKFWDVSGSTILFLYRLKSSKQFEKIKRKYEEDEDVLAIQHIYLDEESRHLVVAASQHVIVYGYRKKELSYDVPVVEVPAIISQNISNNVTGPAEAGHVTRPNAENKPFKLYRLKSAPTLSTYSFKPDVKTSVKAKSGARKYSVGYQPELVVLVQWYEGTTPPIITSVCINSSYGMLAAGTTTSLFIMDTVQKTCLLNIHPAELCNSEIGRLATPTMTSPKKRLPSASVSDQESGAEANSRSTEQMLNGSPSPGFAARHKFRWQTVSTDKPDGGVFSRSRSPSNTSLDVSTHHPVAEVQFLMFADSYSRKLSEGKSLWNKVAKAALSKSKSQELSGFSKASGHSETMSSLWVGTSAGTMMALDVIPYYSERETKPVMLAHSGSTFQLKGTILELCFLNYRGVLVPVEAEMWGNSKESSGDKRGKRLVSRVSRLSMSCSETTNEKSAASTEHQHIAVMVSDSEMRSIALPAQTVLHKEKFQEGMFVVKATAIIMKVNDVDMTTNSVAS